MTLLLSEPCLACCALPSLPLDPTHYPVAPLLSLSQRRPSAAPRGGPGVRARTRRRGTRRVRQVRQLYVCVYAIPVSTLHRAMYPRCPLSACACPHSPVHIPVHPFISPPVPCLARVTCRGTWCTVVRRCTRYSCLCRMLIISNFAPAGRSLRFAMWPSMHGVVHRKHAVMSCVITPLSMSLSL